MAAAAVYALAHEEVEKPGTHCFSVDLFISGQGQ